MGEKRNNWDASAMHSAAERGGSVSFCPTSAAGGLLRVKQQSQEEEEEEEGHDAKS